LRRPAGGRADHGGTIARSGPDQLQPAINSWAGHADGTTHDSRRAAQDALFGMDDGRQAQQLTNAAGKVVQAGNCRGRLEEPRQAVQAVAPSGPQQAEGKEANHGPRNFDTAVQVVCCDLHVALVWPAFGACPIGKAFGKAMPRRRKLRPHWPRRRLANAHDENHALVTEGPERMELHIGNNDWPLPILIVQKGRWHRWVLTQNPAPRKLSIVALAATSWQPRAENRE
jgi:Protein of unknown function (DUF2950)